MAVGTGIGPAVASDPGAEGQGAGQVVERAEPDRSRGRGARAGRRRRRRTPGRWPGRARCHATRRAGRRSRRRRSPRCRPSPGAMPTSGAAVGPLVQEDDAERDHPEHGGVLEIDRVGGRGGLDGRNVETGHGAEAEAQGNHRRPKRPARPRHERQEGQAGEQAAVEGDRQRRRGRATW